MQFVATMTSKGQLTLPVAIRNKWKLQEGDKVDFYFDEASRTAQLLPRNKKLAELADFLRTIKSDATPPSQEDIDKAIDEQIISEHGRINRDAEEFQEFLAWKKRKASAAK